MVWCSLKMMEDSFNIVVDDKVSTILSRYRLKRPLHRKLMKM